MKSRISENKMLLSVIYWLICTNLTWLAQKSVISEMITIMKKVGGVTGGREVLQFISSSGSHCGSQHLAY